MLLTLLRRDAKRTPYPRNGEPWLFADGGHCARARDGKVLYAVDELTGLIGAVALMRPSKSTLDLELKSVKKKYKALNFAAGCSREVIQHGADMLDWTLDDLISDTILAMRTPEKPQAE